MTFEPSWFRWTRLKLLGLVFALVFFALSVLALSYSVLSGLADLNGVDAQVTEVSKVCSSRAVTFSHGGFYRLTVMVDKKKMANIYSLYPQWPGHWMPQKGDGVRVWPSDHPRVAAVQTNGWGWLLLGSIFILGFLFLEFAFLSLSLR
jgi:hypothetical protein